MTVTGAPLGSTPRLINTCGVCHTTYPREALSCPQCHTLTHRDRLNTLAAAARDHAKSRATAEEVAVLEQILELLPGGTSQGAAIQKRLAELNRDKPASKAPVGRLAALGAVGLFLWKFKAIGLFLLTKGKILLIGLMEAKTVLSMALAMGLYWTIWGWPFALGFVLSIYVHEMGHVVALRRAGIPAGAPMFIPFVGAFVRLKQPPRSPSEDAAIGLAGPIYGLAAALACYGAFLLFGVSLLGALARAGAWINLFNLIPVWQLDGGRGFSALSRPQRLRITAITAAAWFLSGETLLVLLLFGCGYQLLFTRAPSESHQKTEWIYVGLLVVLAALSQISLPEVAPF